MTRSRAIANAYAVHHDRRQQTGAGIALAIVIGLSAAVLLAHWWSI